MDFSAFDFVNFTGYIDLAQVLLYGFWAFFAYLLFYLQKETRREGYPLESDETGNLVDHGVIYMPEPKNFLLPHGHGTVSAPNDKRETRELKLRATEPWSGAPKEPTGENPMLDGVGPGAYAQRADVPDLMASGAVKIRPMHMAESFSVAARDPQPIGMPVVGCDREIGGTIVDVWIDQAESVIRYYEVQISVEEGARSVLVPANFVKVYTQPTKEFFVKAITGAQFADVPLTKSPDQITLLEEEKVMGYFGAGYLYATPGRSESKF